MCIILKQQKFSVRMLLSIFLFFCQFQPGVASKSVASEKKRAASVCQEHLDNEESA